MINRRKLIGSTSSLLAASAFSKKSKGKNIPDVAIIGAGLSGLNAALILEEEGLDVIILEARNRVGGRILTLSEVDEMPESGGSEIGPRYARIVDLVQRYKLKLEPWQIMNINFMLHIGGSSIKTEEWFNSPINQLDESIRHIPPFAIQNTLFKKEKTLPELDSWLSPEFYSKDISLYEYYINSGANRQALRFLQLSAQADNIRNESLLWNLRKMKATSFEMGANKPFNLIVGGMSKLPQIMARSLRKEIRLNTVVKGIKINSNNIEIQTTDYKKIEAKYALCTVPASILKSIKIEPNIPNKQFQAISSLPYGQATSVFLKVKEPFWEVDGMGSSLWSDGPIGKAYNWSTPNGKYLWVFLKGINSFATRNWKNNDIMDFTIRELGAMRPSTVNRIEKLAVKNWSKDPFALGTFAYRRPGQIRIYGNIISKPHDRIFFAGEHTSTIQLGMEGAMESGERAAFEILRQT